MNDSLSVLRHSVSHILAYALKEMDPEVEFAIGPPIENGFYYDLRTKRGISIDDFPAVESKMREIINRKLDFERIEMESSEAIALFRSLNQKFKIELIEDLNVESVSLYKVGDFVDLCRGPHVANTSLIPTNAFKLTDISGAYWRGDSSRDMLQRIYGTAWNSKTEMEAYLRLIEEASLRNHKRLGEELGIFHIDEEAVGSVFWLKNGCVLFNIVKDCIVKILKKYGYFLVQTPQLLNKSLWETSGHWDKFRENMFIVNNEDKIMAIKPMNCPAHIIIYKTGSVKSYRDLPVRMAEFGVCHRNESSGSLYGLMRLRAFMQDDGHVFCRRDQIIEEAKSTYLALKELYALFGFTDITVKFSDRPEKRAGSDDIWDIAEKSLLEAADASGLKYTINKGEGAFYGPKLEFVLKDCLGRDWQCGTLQCDFVLPERFGIRYVDSDGARKTPVMLHRALVGSLERFIGILIEHYAGKFPFWLAPIQIAVASVTDESATYAKKIFDLLSEADYRCVLDIENEKIGYKIRAYSMQKIPVTIIIGRKEKEDNIISVRQLATSATDEVDFSNILMYFTKLFEKSQNRFT